jgi:hypothetical protein
MNLFTIAIVVLLLIITILIVSQKSEETLEDLFNTTGLLVNNYGIDWFEKMLSHGDVNLSDTAACAAVNRHTCTACSFIRNDLIPMFFMVPGIAMNVPCGIILNPQKVWPLITVMSIIDANTNTRSCGTNESGTPLLTRNPFMSNAGSMCVYNTLKAKYGESHKYVTGKWATFMPNIDSGGSCPISCNGDLTCMYQNSGGNINRWIMDSSPECISGKYKDCYTFTEVSEKDVDPSIKNLFSSLDKPDGYLAHTMSQECETCKKPYVCVFDNSMEPNKPFQTVEESNRIATYIGQDGSGFVPNTMDVATISGVQCRFEKKDWESWIGVLKQYYRRILKLMKPDNSMISEHIFPPESGNLTTFTAQLANPLFPCYFENEVNLYINPDTSSNEYKNQNKIWQDAILGFYYVGTTCEEQFDTLNGVPSTAWDYKKNEWKTFNSAADRCDGFFQIEKPEFTTETRRQWEENNKKSARDMVHKVADMFNKNHPGKNIPVYRCSASSNFFPSYKDMTNALNGNVKLNQIFQEDKN